MRFFREHKLITIIAVILILLIIFFAVSVSAANKAEAREKAGLSRPTGISYFFSKTGSSIKSVFKGAALEKKIKQLDEENQRLERELMEAKLSKEQLERLEELSKLLDYQYKDLGLKFVAADVKFGDATNFVDDFVINAGQKNGVQSSDTVVYGGNLVGKVEQVGKDWARVVGVTSSRVSISFKLERDGLIRGIVSGNGKKSLEGYMLDSEDEVKVGDVLVTSGIGTYEEGIKVGTIKEIKYNSKTLTTEITVEPACDMNSLNMVAVIVE